MVDKSYEKTKTDHERTHPSTPSVLLMELQLKSISLYQLFKIDHKFDLILNSLESEFLTVRHCSFTKKELTIHLTETIKSI